VHDHFVTAVAVGDLHDRSLAASGDAAETVRPVVATTRRDAALTPASPRVDQGGSLGSGGKILQSEETAGSSRRTSTRLGSGHE
jgi:hypothetical protein